MTDAINWILTKTEATEVQWRRFNVGPTINLKENILGVTYQAKCAKESSKFFKKAYVGLRGQREVICLVIIDLKGQWHFIDATSRGKTCQLIQQTFSGFFDQRCYVNKKHKSVY